MEFATSEVANPHQFRGGGGAVVARKMMKLSPSFDHRVVDGIDAARFVQALRSVLEAPALLLAE